MIQPIDHTAIAVNDVHKDFHLPHERANSIKTSLVHFFTRDKSYEIQHALRGVSFEIKKGEFFGILGRNGSGKSTLLKILAEIYRPTRGSVRHYGKLVPFIELGVGFNPELTGRENVYLNGALLGFSVREIDERYEEIVKFAELEDFMDQKLKNYSSGMQVRLAFSVATRAEADILLVDEVLAVGDADFQRKCFDYFKSLKKVGKTVVFVTHDMGAVREYCDRAILIEDGHIKVSGTADNVANEYLKLFNKTNPEPDTTDDKPSRWGDGRLNVIDHKLLVDKDIKLDFTVRAKQKVEGVVMGFRFYDINGNILAGASTLNARSGAKENISFEEGEVKKITFSSVNILGTGDYRLGYTLRLSDGVTICENDDSFVSFSYNRPESYQPIICPVKLSIRSKTDA